MDHYTPERLILQAHESMVRIAEDRARLVPGLTRPSFRPWMATRLRGLADRLDGRPAAAHLRLVP